MIVLVTDYTLRNIISTNDEGIVAMTGRAHCQCQVAFFPFGIVLSHMILIPAYSMVNVGFHFKSKVKHTRQISRWTDATKSFISQLHQTCAVSAVKILMYLEERMEGTN